MSWLTDTHIQSTAIGGRIRKYFQGDLPAHHNQKYNQNDQPGHFIKCFQSSFRSFDTDNALNCAGYSNDYVNVVFLGIFIKFE